ncbi:hypothetical protein [Enterovibrio sp. 27052020O]|uniref:hypothetical protein n=1 Tax=Enterovibrio sp. 27052020O TaxID=3241166 RepID=UPI00388E030E
MEVSPVAQDKEQRKASIAAARKAHHASQTASKKRVDAYVTEETKEGLKEIKALSPDVRNEGQAIDLAVKLALAQLKKPSQQ